MKENKKLSIRRPCFTPYELSPYLIDFCCTLRSDGFTELTIGGYAGSIAHLGTWLYDQAIALQDVDQKVLKRFSIHKCSCLGYTYEQRLSSRYINRVLKFVEYLRTRKVIPHSTSKQVESADQWDRDGFTRWLSDERGLAPITVMNYLRGVDGALTMIGYETDKYSAASIRSAVTEHAKRVGPINAKRLITSLRAYLRFLQVQGLCRSGLIAAVPTIPQWRLSSLPRYISDSEVQEIINSCDTSKIVGLRDRAILLLLSRLGLRAADIVNLSINDIDWTCATIRLVGKSRREVRLPLPQDADDAIIQYLEQGRFDVSSTRLFLCSNAPHRPLSGSPTVSGIVSAAVIRSGIDEPPSSGTNLLRHSAATHMLRLGVGLDAISTVLRHKSADTTLIYAKVDVDTLNQLATPWLEYQS